jgi:hypothetical protein
LGRRGTPAILVHPGNRGRAVPPAPRDKKATLVLKGRPVQPDLRDQRVTRAIAVRRANQGRPDRPACKGHRVLKVSRVHRVWPVRAARLAHKVFAALPRLFQAPRDRPVRLAPLALLASPVRKASSDLKVRSVLRANKD